MDVGQDLLRAVGYFKKCSDCKEIKSLDEFSTYYCKARRKRRIHSSCKPCSIARLESLKSGMTDTEKKKYHRRIKLRNCYRMTEKEYDDLYSSQEGKCAICGDEETWKRKSECVPLAVDHDHKTGKVRGLLCIRCNLLIGKARDNPELLLKCAAYLRSDAHEKT